VTPAGQPRFGIWAPVRGTFAALTYPGEPVDASWARNRDAVLAAERLGFHSTLVAQHTVNPLGDERGQLEAWTATAALAALTERIELIVAIKPLLFHPVVLAKQALQIEEISDGRLSLNVVNAWFRPELERSGIGFPAHDERYAYGREWLEIVVRLLRGERVTFAGEHFSVHELQLRPLSPQRERPLLYVGGESEPARTLAVDLADVWFVNGQPLEDVEALFFTVRDRLRRPAAGPLRYGMPAFVIARPTEDEANAELALQWQLDAAHADVRERMLANTDHSAQMFRSFQTTARIGTNGGTAAGLVGDYDTVAARIAAFHAIGVETFMFQFQPLISEMERFAAEVAPRVSRLVGAETATAR
jgi:alkanesulfonate monooxygenase